MRQELHYLELTAIVSFRLAGKTPQQAPRDAQLVVAAPLEEPDILQHRAAFVHELQYMAVQALDAGLDDAHATLVQSPNLLAT